jgi:hypothetical protein
VPSRGLRYGRSVFATALFVALVVAGWGFVSLLTETEVVADPEVGPIVAPVSVVISAVAVLFALASPRWSTVAGRGVGAVVGHDDGVGRHLTGGRRGGAHRLEHGEVGLLGDLDRGARAVVLVVRVGLVQTGQRGRAW